VPAAVDAEGHANRQTEGRDRRSGEVLGVEDHDVAEVAFRVVHVRFIAGPNVTSWTRTSSNTSRSSSGSRRVTLPTAESAPSGQPVDAGSAARRADGW
jgi:hypothetical protein